MRVHFIAIGGAVMHNLAMALHYKGFEVSGSDDAIYEPAHSRLKKLGILPEEEGWFPSKITSTIDAVILGMHAKPNNPELIKAQELGLKIYSFPEYLYEQTKNKKRIVIAGSHGKTTITSMVLFVLNYYGKKIDYMVGAQIEGFDTMVGLLEESEIAIFEGDEYLTSPLDLRPKFMHYKPHIACITGIEWDHINVFPTWQNYVHQYELLLGEVEKMNGKIFLFMQDEHIRQLAEKTKANYIFYDTPKYEVVNEKFIVETDTQKYTLRIFGKHNMQNVKVAQLLCAEVGIAITDFYTAIQHFGGAAKRLETIKRTNEATIYRDFAHAPSKVRATVQALVELHNDKKIIAFFELHTFSSLNKNFIEQYKNTLQLADTAYVYYSIDSVKSKNMELMSNSFIADKFGIEEHQIINTKSAIEQTIKNNIKSENVVLLMSSGTFDNFDFASLK